MDRTPHDLPIKIEKPWGYEIWYAWTDDYVGKIIHINKGGKLSLQYHVQKDETSYVLKGCLWLSKGSAVDKLDVSEIHEGHMWRNKPGEIHSLEAIEEAEILEVSTPHLDDVVRLEDLYGREGTNSP